MSDADLRQDEELRHNRRTDLAQWLVIAVVALGGALYVNLVLVKALSIQGDTIGRITERCK